eukprot:CAMPEP_0174370298 /NCGR_PEP_ID=MMETSP0811_2-20130205/95661_1 /TAXON_ID=73025 ORGANISM="Eutreptiella gymnastica-like, Strain CCMP1594" /NCGR_SAMPLE_ID=MMETSP0811_2 /ASSEMBLY_ACC=CAM_ASM_000667 /LENGTH=39 /DNA_ID= /DNA_START= /DNA_END= /DNA_ORIENTATION=
MSPLPVVALSTCAQASSPNAPSPTAAADAHAIGAVRRRR